MVVLRLDPAGVLQDRPRALRKEVLAEGREAGRREALEGITDRVTNALKDK